MKLVRVPLRISFCGGGSDLPSHFNEHGGAVFSAAINKYIYIAVKDGSNLFPHKYRLVYSKVEECNDASEIKHPIIKQLVDDYNIGNLDLDVMSDVPAGTGLGSSSAFTVGLHAALGYSANKHALASAACRTEIDDLKEPIGKQDQYACALGGLNYIKFSSGRTTVDPVSFAWGEYNRFRGCLTLIRVEGTRSASAILQSQNNKPGLLDAMADEALLFDYYLRAEYYAKLGPCIQRNWELKKRLSPRISNPVVDNIIDQALKCGATGGKLLGAGGAGFVLLFCLPENRLKMLNGLEHLKLNYVPFDFDHEGVKVLYED